MASKAITIYTPASAAPHIGAQDDAFIYDTLLEGRSGVFGELSCEATDSNTVTLSGGGAVNRGYIMYVPQGETQTLNISNCGQGLERIDIIAAAFTKGDGNTADSHVFEVVQGTAAAVAEEPEVESTEPLTAGDVCRLPLFCVRVGGAGITSVEQIAQDAVTVSTVARATVADSCSGNAETAGRADSAAEADEAEKLSVPRTIALSGDASGSADFDGSEDVSVAVSVTKIGGKRIFIQQSEPSAPAVGDLWLW